jgi:hypothetical protein
MFDHALGYYKVNNEIILDKAEAVYKANINKSEIEWYFNDEKFKTVNWLNEPELSLDELYKIRAQQIRDNFDYVLIFVSGGADSTNVLYSFVNNNIRVDEIVASAPISGLKSWSISKDLSAENTISETFLTQFPLVEDISKKHPSIKITIHDYFEDMLKFKTDDWLFKSGSYIHPTFAARYNLDRYPHIKEIAEKGKKIALVYGLDKPYIVKKNNSYYSTIFDVFVCNAFKSIQYPNAIPILFYYTPELPEMLVKQAHVTLNYISKPENTWLFEYLWYNEDFLDARINNIQFENNFHSGIYERNIIPSIYPTLKKRSFQCNKPNRAFMGQHDNWLYSLHKNSKLVQMLDSDYLHYVKNIDKKYFYFYKDGFIRGFKRHYKSFKIKVL